MTTVGLEAPPEIRKAFKDMMIGRRRQERGGGRSDGNVKLGTALLQSKKGLVGRCR